MKQTIIIKPQAISTYTVTTVTEQNITYNESGYSYNQATIKYGGAEQKSSRSPKNF